VALENFKTDIPAIIEALRSRIEEAGNVKPAYITARDTFHELCKVEINPEITLADIREMMIQHILTSDIFNKIFDDPDFHRHNSIARELEKLIDILFTYSDRRNLLGAIEHYYDAINATAASITDHHEKQKFLKVLYENFYKVYNPKAADRLGVVYTPNEIVRFMVQGTDYLLEKHFGKTLADEGVEILDPAVGTGTFICDIIEHLPKQHLLKKYKNELHASEVAILPYYIANLNIEYTFKQKVGFYEEFPNLCFVDTLDNTGGLSYKGQQHSLFGLSSENAERINRQNSKKISVIIGNPPYNANQKNFNDFNQNRSYPDMDLRIKNTYVKYSVASNKANLYDMYTRFFRWASDRLDKNGVLSFVSNNSFINAKAFDGFRKCVEEEFNEIYIVNLKGDARTSGERRRKEGGNVFSDLIRVGVSVYFFLKNDNKTGCKIFYNEISDYKKAEDKKEYLHVNSLNALTFTEIISDNKHNWISQSENDWDDLLPLIDKDVKSGKSKNAVFELYSLGIASHRDQWVYDFSKENLVKKLNYFIDIYQKTLENQEFSERNKIAWDRELNNYRIRCISKSFENTKVKDSLFRPFVHKFHYFDRHFNGMFYQWGNLISDIESNIIIAVNKEANNKDLHCIASSYIFDLHSTGDSQCLPLFRFDENKNRIDNITDWALEQFRARYEGGCQSSVVSQQSAVGGPESDSDSRFRGNDAEPGTLEPGTITKTDIFHYVYAVLHNPSYRKKYELNLKREFPRIPFYEDFRKWSEWGKQLMDLHINFETVEPWPLEVIEKQSEKPLKELRSELLSEAAEIDPMFVYQPKIKVKLKVEQWNSETVKHWNNGTIEQWNKVIVLDELTTLAGIPPIAWEYKLGNRSALEWILDQYKEKKPSDPTIAEKFNTYRFADYKEKVIDLLQRVCTVSVRTMEILKEME